MNNPFEGIEEEEWTDDTVITWGKHKGKRLEEVPAGYLLWLYEQDWIHQHVGLYKYIKKNEDVLMDQKADEDDLYYGPDDW